MWLSHFQAQMILEASDEIEQMDQFLEEMAFNAQSVVWGVKNQQRALINKLFSEIKTNWERYLIEGAIHFLEMALKAGDVDPAVLGT